MDLRSARRVVGLAVDIDQHRDEPEHASARELRSLQGAIEQAAEVLLAADPRSALRLVAALAGFWQDEGLVERGRALTIRVLDTVGTTGTAGPATTAGTSREFLSVLAQARTAASELAFRQGDQAAATSQAQLAIDSATAAGDSAAAAMAWLMLARVGFRDEDAEAIERAARAAESLAGDDPLVRRGALHMLAWAAHTAGDLALARARFEASLAFRREVGAGPLSEAVELGNIAELDLTAGGLAAAASGFRDVLGTATRLGNRYLLVNTLPSVAALAAAAGMDEEAAELFGASDQLQVESGLTTDPGGESMVARAGLAGRLGALRFGEAVSAGRALAPDARVARAVELCSRIAGKPNPAALAGGVVT